MTCLSLLLKVLPGGKMMPFNLFLVLFIAGGWLAGRLSGRAGLPSILGMVLFGILLGLLPDGTVPPLIGELSPFLKSLALVVILLRAGLGISKSTLMRVGPTALLLAVVPCLFEASVVILAYHYLFSLPWITSAVGAFIIAAVSPAVVVPSMLALKEEGHGKVNEVPTLILAGASVDDVVAITFFSLFLMMAIPGGGVEGVAASRTLIGSGGWWSILSIPLSIPGGVILGLVAGYLLSRWFLHHYGRIRATEKALLLLAAALLLVEIGDHLHLAALLGVMTLGFVLLEQAEPVAHELSSKLAKVWVPSEIILFVLIGMAVEVPVALAAGPKGLLLIAAGLGARSLGVLLSTAFDRRLSRGERLFCVIAYLPKATVQAALGAVPLGFAVPGGEILLSVSVLAILVTAPVGLLLIRRLGPRLLPLDA